MAGAESRIGRVRRGEGAGVSESWTAYGLEATEELGVESKCNVEPLGLRLSTAVMEEGGREKGQGKFPE